MYSGTSSFKPPSSEITTHSTYSDTHRFCPTTNVTAKPFGAATNTSPKPFGSTFKYEQPDQLSKLQDSFGSDYKSSSFNTLEPYGEGYRISEYSTNVTKTPGGYRTDSYKYETYQSSSKPVDTFSSTTEKYFTTTPQESLQFTPIKTEFDSFKNGSDYQSAFSSNVEIINDPPVIRDSDSLEQKMLKKSVRQQIIEKKTVTTTKTSKQESSSKNFRLE